MGYTVVWGASPSGILFSQESNILGSRVLEAHSFIKNILKLGTARVLHACNPGYSVGRDRENCVYSPAQAQSLQDPITTEETRLKGCTCLSSQLLRKHK
jgi:hypothetical protein